MKKQLIKEVDKFGNTIYWTNINGERATEYTINEEKAFKDFEQAFIFEPSKTVIKEEEI